MANIRIGKPDVAPDAAAHTKGVIQGNRGRKQKGLHPDGKADAHRSTGIRPKQHEPIMPIMPNLPPG